VALVRSGDEGRIGRSIVVRPGAAYPPPVGSVVGRIVLRGPEGPLGAVPIVVADVPAPTPPRAPWWVRAAGALARALTAAVDGLFG
jgi:hypothetical protein